MEICPSLAFAGLQPSPSKTIVGSPSLSSERFIRLDAPIVFLQPQCAKSTAPSAPTVSASFLCLLYSLVHAAIINAVNHFFGKCLVRIIRLHASETIRYKIACTDMDCITVIEHILHCILQKTAWCASKVHEIHRLPVHVSHHLSEAVYI